MKDIDEARHRLKGLFNIAVTPFTRDGEIDLAALSENLERMLSFGVDGILIGGTYGEFATMSATERLFLFRQVMDLIADRVPVMLCAASSDPREARELTEQASGLGGIPMLTAPFVSEVTDDQIFAFFADVSRLSRTGIVIYNAPGIGITLSLPLLERLAEQEYAVALKQGDLSPAVIDGIANRLAGRMRLFCASDLAFLGPLMCGFDGLSSTNSCALPELIANSYLALRDGDAAMARDLHRLWFPFRELARKFGQPQTVKAVMRLRGWRGGFVRPPLTDLTPAELTELEEAMQSIPPEWRSSEDPAVSAAVGRAVSVPGHR